MTSEGKTVSDNATVKQIAARKNRGDLYELAKILGHSNIKMTERYAKLAKHHIARTATPVAKCGSYLNRSARKRL